MNFLAPVYFVNHPPDDGLQIRPKHVEVDWQNKLRTNSASSWVLLHRCIEMHGQQNIKYSNFNVHLSMYRNDILVYKIQQDAHVTEFI
jgi:sRNA-binding regulator protein Hfq